MKGDARIIEILNEVLTAELTAINQYFVHAEEVIERVLFLEGVPNLQRLGKINIGENVQEIMQADYALELEALPRLQQGIEVCRELGDNNSRHLLEEILE